MCGFLGLLSKELGNTKVKKILNVENLLHHRGPDNTGTFKSKNLIFVHKRLSIVDIEGGTQPIINAGCVLVANGEIYNDLELRNLLKDFKYKTNSDCETIIAVYKKYGIKGFEKLRGMFSFAIYDKTKKELILSRDSFGIKPLYFFQDNNNFIFSSEIKPLIESKLIQKKLDKRKILELVQIQFNSGRNTIFKNIVRIRPGETLVIKDFKIIKSKIIKIENSKKSIVVSHNKLKDKLLESVYLHQRSDVPYGVFFSGGIDSTLILYLMSLINNKPIKAFNIFFKGKEKKNEEIALLANRFGANLKSIEFSENDFWNILPKSISFMDDPVSDYAIIPTYKLASEAKNYVKVVLTGEGGDELFAGYGRYRDNLRKLFRKRFLSRGILDKFLAEKNKMTKWDFDLSFVKSKIFDYDLTSLQKNQIFDYYEWLPNNILIKLDRCLMAHSIEGRTPLVDKDLFENFFFMTDKNKIKNNYGKYCLRSFLNNEIPFYKAFSKKEGFTVPILEWIPKKSKILSDLLPKSKILNELLKPSKIKSLCMNTKNNKKNSIIVWRLLFFSIWFLIHHENIKESGNSFDILENYN